MPKKKCDEETKRSKTRIAKEKSSWELVFDSEHLIQDLESSLFGELIVFVGRSGSVIGLNLSLRRHLLLIVLMMIMMMMRMMRMRMRLELNRNRNRNMVRMRMVNGDHVSLNRNMMMKGRRRRRGRDEEAGWRLSGRPRRGDELRCLRVESAKRNVSGQRRI